MAIPDRKRRTETGRETQTNAGSARPGAGGGPPGAGASPEVSPYRWLILIGLILAAMMEVLDTTIVNVALPQMAGNLNATTDEIGWVATGYILSNVIVLPMTAWLSSRFGRRRYLTASILIFIIASFFCGTSRTLMELVFWRIAQGAGGAALLSTAQAAVREVFPREQQGIVQAVFLLGIVVSPTLGPTLGGYITDNYNWPWVFFVNVPIGVVSMALVYTFLEDSRFQRRGEGVDWTGIGLLAVGLGALQYVLEEGERDDWFDSVAIVRLSILAGITLIAFVFWELSPRNRHPVVELRILTNKALTAALVLFLALGFGLYGAIFIFPMFTQNILGFPPTETGLVLLPGGIATAIGVMICGRLLNGQKPLVNPRYLIFFGVALFVVSMWQLGHLTTASGIPDTRFALIIRGFGLGFLFTPINMAAFASLKGAQIAQGSGLINLTRQLGGSFGIAVLNTQVVTMTKLHRTDLVANLYSGNPLLAQRQAALTQVLVAHGYGLTAAKSAALATISRIVQAQAMTQSYNDAFLLLGVTFLLASPAVFLLGGRKAGGGMPAAGGH